MVRGGFKLKQTGQVQRQSHILNDKNSQTCFYSQLFTRTQNCAIPLESVRTLEGNGELLLKIREWSTHTQLEDL